MTEFMVAFSLTCAGILLVGEISHDWRLNVALRESLKRDAEDPDPIHNRALKAMVARLEAQQKASM